MSNESPKLSFWPHGLVAVIVLFVVGMIGLVIFVSNQHFDLVQRDYYAEEIRYQDQIDRKKRTKAVADTMSLKFDRSSKQVAFQLPEQHRGKQLKDLEARLYRPSDAKLDQRPEFQPNADGKWELDTSNLAVGRWVLDLTWQVAEEEFFARLELTQE